MQEPNCSYHHTLHNLPLHWFCDRKARRLSTSPISVLRWRATGGHMRVRLSLWLLQFKMRRPALADSEVNGLKNGYKSGRNMVFAHNQRQLYHTTGARRLNCAERHSCLRLMNFLVTHASAGAKYQARQISLSPGSCDTAGAKWLLQTLQG